MRMLEDNICCDTCYDPSDDICKLVKEGWDKFSKHMALLFRQLCESNNCCVGMRDNSNIERMLRKFNSSPPPPSIDIIINIPGTVEQYADNVYSETPYYFTPPANIENYNVCNDGVKLYTEEIETYNMSNINQRKKIVYTPDETSSSDYSENDSYTDYSSQDMSSSISSDELCNDTQHISSRNKKGDNTADKKDDKKIDKKNAYTDCINNELKTMEGDNVNLNNDIELTDNDKFLKNLRNNLLVLSELEEGSKLWIDEETQRLYIDSTIGQSITRRLYGQGKAKTLEFIKRMIDTAELQETLEYTNLLNKAKNGVKNIANTYKKSAWFGKYPEVDELEKIIDEKGWNHEEK